MKYILLIFGILLFAACKQEPSKYIVRAVHNSCTGKWAVQTGDTVYFGLEKEEEGYSFTTREEYWHIDTLDNVKAGKELQFSNPDSAIITYLHWSGNPDTVQKYRAIYHAKEMRNKEIADSIFKCNHTYN